MFKLNLRRSKLYLATTIFKLGRLFILSFAIAILINIIHLQQAKSQTNITDLPFAQVSPINNLQENIIQQGSQVQVNNRIFPLSWIQWQENNTIHTAIADVGISNILGLDLISTNNPSLQPVQWFSFKATLPAKFINPNRYLDITTFIPVANINLTTNGDMLNINNSPTKINNIYIKEETWGKQLIVELNQPTFWQTGQVNNQGIVKIDAVANPVILQAFAPPPEPIEEEIKPRDDILTDDIVIEKEPPELPLLIVENKDINQVILNINLPDTKKIKVSSIDKKLIIDLRDDALLSKNIVWYPGLNWQQTYLNIVNDVTKTNNSFPVTYLEIDNTNKDIYLKPITLYQNQMEGINPLVSTARNEKAIAAINAGFFNRNNKLPLGAIKSDNNWLSGPILNRGALAWDNQGKYKFGRLSLEENVITEKGDRLPIILLNTAYIKAGIARYTPSWGDNYTTLSDQENIVIVENDIIETHITSLQAGKESFNIPKNGYLLVLRSFSSALSRLPIGEKIAINSQTYPADFDNYPNIIAAGPLLVENSKIVLDGEAEGFSKPFNQQSASRSAIALKKDGNLIIVAVHNRIGGRGPSLKEMANIMLKLGAINALNLDGGSSTSLYLGEQLIDRSPLSAARVHNGIGIFVK